VALAAIPLNMGLNFVLIPLTQGSFGNGGVGAAIATLLTEFGVMIAALSLIPKHLCGSMRVGVIIKAICIAPAICGVGVLLDSMGFPWVIRAVAVVITYIYSLHVLEVLDSAEIDFIRDFFSARNLRKMVPLRREVEA
jgi:Na+-driven multidrug efflux pump